MTKVVVGMGYEKSLLSSIRGAVSLPKYDCVSVTVNSSHTGIALFGSPFYFGKDKSKQHMMESFSFLVNIDENEQQYSAMSELDQSNVNGVLNHLINFCNNIRVRSNVSARNLLETELLLLAIEEFPTLKKSLKARIKIILTC